MGREIRSVERRGLLVPPSRTLLPPAASGQDSLHTTRADKNIVKHGFYDPQTRYDRNGNLSATAKFPKVLKNGHIVTEEDLDPDDPGHYLQHIDEAVRAKLQTDDLLDQLHQNKQRDRKRKEVLFAIEQQRLGVLDQVGLIVGRGSSGSVEE